MAGHGNNRTWRKAWITAVLLLFAALALILAVSKKKQVRVLTDSEIRAVLASNVYRNAKQEKIVSSAVSLAGRVHYFWGGKYYKLGEDPEWGTPKTVTSEGSSTTGTVRPYGLDCSGYVTWAYAQAGVSASEIGDGTWAQWHSSNEIRFRELRPGDLVFQNSYPESRGNHVGLCIGFLDGAPVIAHCSAAYDNVVVTAGAEGFRYARRPNAAP